MLHLGLTYSPVLDLNKLQLGASKMNSTGTGGARILSPVSSTGNSPSFAFAMEINNPYNVTWSFQLFHQIGPLGSSLTLFTDSLLGEGK